MGTQKLIRFFEHDRVNFSTTYLLVGQNEGQEFVFEKNKKYQRSLSIYHQNGGSDYFSLEHNGIKFKQFVGAIQVDDLTIEILPKVDREVEGDKVFWHSILLDMLKACKKLKPSSKQSASLNLKHNSILELYLELYVDELEYIFHSGLIKKYKKAEGNLNVLKGALVFSKHIQQNLIHAERFYTRHTEYNQSHALHQVLKQALEICDQLSSSYRLTDRIKRLLLVWPEHKQVQIYPSLFQKFKNDRKSASYHEALVIAKLLLLNFHPDIKGGNEHVLSLMFDMNRLWEEFVYQKLLECSDALGVVIHQQTHVDFWNSEHSTKQVKPDLVLISNGKTVVLDTKWKQPDDFWPNDNDLKQMFVYKLYYYADDAILLYPGIVESNSTVGNFHNELHHTVKHKNNFAINTDLNLGCRMGFLNILVEGKLLDRNSFVENIRLCLPF